MPSRRKPRQSKKTKTLTTPPIPSPNHHSPPTLQFKGKRNLEPLKEQNGSLRPISERYPYVVVEEEKSKKKGYSLSAGAGALISANYSKMEGSFNGTLEETQKLQESQSEDKEVLVEEIKSSSDFRGEAAAADDKSRSLSETQDGDSTIVTDEQTTESEENRELVDSGKVEVTEDVSESVVDSSANDFSDATKAPADNLLPSDTVELELKEEHEKDFPPSEEFDGVKGVKEAELLPSEENNQASLVAGNEYSGETEVVETIKLPSLPPTDVVSKETLETAIPKPDESEEFPPTIAEAVPTTDEKVGEPSDVQGPSRESANESSQTSANVPAAETTSATVQDKAEIPRSTENSVGNSHS